MNLLYISFGKTGNVPLQAAFSIYSFAQQRGVETINIVTDAPGYYQHLQNLISITQVDEKLINDWKGPHQFFWRAKIKAIELMAKKYPGKAIVYLDTDTFLYGEINTLYANLLQGKSIMHQNEGLLSRVTGKTVQKMWQQVNGKTFGGIKIEPTANMWNAGVVAIPNTKEGAECENTLQLCDAMCAAGVTPRLIEQLALSVVLEKMYGLLPAAGVVAHYWSNKEEWSKKISQFFIQQYFINATQTQIIEAVQNADFGKTAIEKRERNTAKRLYKLIDKLIPAKGIKYLPDDNDSIKK